MNLHDDFSQRVLLHTADMPWIPSPTAGVQRRMLDRIGGEVARATSIVRYAPGSLFPAHTHGGGEEFLVLEGVFQDEHGDYAAGTYCRNPPMTRHTPGSLPGCTIFVKLWQFDQNDGTRLVSNTDTLYLAAHDPEPGIARATVFEDHREVVRIEQWTAGARIERALPGGAELLVLEGICEEHGDAMRPLSWLRIPAGSRLSADAGPQGTRVWIKSGGLRFAGPPPS